MTNSPREIFSLSLRFEKSKQDSERGGGRVGKAGFMQNSSLSFAVNSGSCS